MLPVRVRSSDKGGGGVAGDPLTVAGGESVASAGAAAAGAAALGVVAALAAPLALALADGEREAMAKHTVGSVSMRGSWGYTESIAGMD